MLRPIEAILETCLYVDDLAAAKAFYTATLGLRCLDYDPDRHLFLDLEPGNLLLFLPAASDDGGEVAGQVVPPHGAHGPGHLALAMDGAAMDDWKQHLLAHQVAIESEITWPQGGRSLYFRDPAGNSLELAEPRIWGPIED